MDARDQEDGIRGGKENYCTRFCNSFKEAFYNIAERIAYNFRLFVMTNTASPMQVDNLLHTRLLARYYKLDYKDAITEKIVTKMMFDSFAKNSNIPHIAVWTFFLSEIILHVAGILIPSVVLFPYFAEATSMALVVSTGTIIFICETPSRREKNEERKRYIKEVLELKLTNADSITNVSTLKLLSGWRLINPFSLLHFFTFLLHSSSSMCIDILCSPSLATKKCRSEYYRIDNSLPSEWLAIIIKLPLFIVLLPISGIFEKLAEGLEGLVLRCINCIKCKKPLKVEMNLAEIQAATVSTAPNSPKDSIAPQSLQVPALTQIKISVISAGEATPSSSTNSSNSSRSTPLPLTPSPSSDPDKPSLLRVLTGRQDKNIKYMHCISASMGLAIPGSLDNLVDECEKLIKTRFTKTYYKKRASLPSFNLKATTKLKLPPTLEFKSISEPLPGMNSGNENKWVNFVPSQAINTNNNSPISPMSSILEEKDEDEGITVIIEENEGDVNPVL